MKITELLKSDKPCISCELFPPKAGSELQNALKIVDEIAVIKPHFMSVTYGAGGTSAGQTLAIAQAVEEHNIPALAHLTCIDATEAKIDDMLGNFRKAGVQNVLALRGDAVTSGVRDFAHASDLMRKISSSGDFCIGGACYPEGRPAISASAERAIRKDTRRQARWITTLKTPKRKLTQAANFWYRRCALTIILCTTICTGCCATASTCR